MRGYVPTPPELVDAMVGRLFAERVPSADDVVLDPGCGPGAFIEGILRWCARHGAPVPRLVGIEADAGRAAQARRRFAGNPRVAIEHRDFLAPSSLRGDFVVGNPPYVPITGLAPSEREAFRARYVTARGRFDLYLLFFEEALRRLRPGGRLVFVTPEKYLYVHTAAPLRRLLGTFAVREVALPDESVFTGRVTYPAVTVVDQAPAAGATLVVLRDGTRRRLAFPADGSSLRPLLSGYRPTAAAGPTLADACRRISCGVATGADAIFVHAAATLPAALAPFARPTVSGRQLVPGGVEPRPRDVLLVPYDAQGRLLPREALGALGRYLLAPARRRRLQARTCARRKPCWAFHDSVPLPDLLRPKLLWKDIASAPAFLIDRAGTLVPRHSVYYLVPRDPAQLEALARHLGSPAARAWMDAHCQRAARGFLRLQSAVLKDLPVPAALAGR